MVPRIRFVFSTVLFVCGVSLAQNSGIISGKVTDRATKEPLPFATVAIQMTALGTATDRDGTYRLPGVPVGAVRVSISYIGYQAQTHDLTIDAGDRKTLDVELEQVVLEGEGVVVTAQLKGQAEAISRQLSAPTIMNVVSADKITELPDQNAAEALGRLPAISVQRDAGEGQKVVVRGLAPKFNSITIGGDRIPSTDPEDRSVDLSMISPDMLAGIEVMKALTADKDADAVGGAVNFVVRKAAPGFKLNARAETGYNHLERATGQYKTSVTISDRFFENLLGVVASANLQRANRSSDVLNADYNFKREQTGTEERGVVEVTNLNLADRLEQRDRGGASLALDYDLGDGSVMLNGFWSRTDRDEVRRRLRYRVGVGRLEYDLRDRRIETALGSGSLSGEHRLGILEIAWRGSMSESRQDIPYSHTARFEELAAFLPTLIDDAGPELIPLGAKHDTSQTFFKESALDNSTVNDRDKTGQLDFKLRYSYGSDIAGTISAGLKTRRKDRSRDNTRYWTQAFNINSLGSQLGSSRWQLTPDLKIKLVNFLDPGFDDPRFLNENPAYDFVHGLDRAALARFVEEFRYHQLTSTSSLYVLDPLVDLDDYNASETIWAGYLMTDINIGQTVMILPGVRYEHTASRYRSVFGTPNRSDETNTITGISDTTGNRSYGDWLPMLHLRYRPTTWFDVRVAVTRSLSRPNYFDLVPWERVQVLETMIERGNPQLRQTRVWNYDLFTSFYGDFGLVTLGAFAKDVRDVAYKSTTRIQGGTYNGYQLTVPYNAEGVSKVRGVEIEVQTNLKNLPFPFDGIVISANYARIWSETAYPFFEIGPRSPLPPFRPTIIDTIRIGRMPGQADHLVNLALGYEYGGFTGRLSMVYQGSSLSFVGQRAELDGYADAFLRIDLALQQKLASMISVFLNVNNVTSRPEVSYLGIRDFPTAEEYFGFTADVGVRVTF